MPLHIANHVPGLSGNIVVIRICLSAVHMASPPHGQNAGNGAPPRTSSPGLPNMVYGTHIIILKEMLSGRWAYIGKMPLHARRVHPTPSGASTTIAANPLAAPAKPAPSSEPTAIPASPFTPAIVAVKMEEEPIPKFGFLKKKGAAHTGTTPNAAQPLRQTPAAAPISEVRQTEIPHIY
jgi:hypothetical protein